LRPPAPLPTFRRALARPPARPVGLPGLLLRLPLRPQMADPLLSKIRRHLNPGAAASPPSGPVHAGGSSSAPHVTPSAASNAASPTFAGVSNLASPAGAPGFPLQQPLLSPIPNLFGLVDPAAFPTTSSGPARAASSLLSPSSFVNQQYSLYGHSQPPRALNHYRPVTTQPFQDHAPGLQPSKLHPSYVYGPTLLEQHQQQQPQLLDDLHEGWRQLRWRKAANLQSSPPTSSRGAPATNDQRKRGASSAFAQLGGKAFAPVPRGLEANDATRTPEGHSEDVPAADETAERGDAPDLLSNIREVTHFASRTDLQKQLPERDYSANSESSLSDRFLSESGSSVTHSLGWSSPSCGSRSQALDYGSSNLSMVTATTTSSWDGHEHDFDKKATSSVQEMLEELEAYLYGGV
ncbi:MAG: hypothetical protein BJ554DRAFT_3321, partial [Olpidium bornovanus]